MFGSIQRGWLRLTRQSFVPAVILVGVHGSFDPTGKNVGYRGMLQVPIPASATVDSNGTAGARALAEIRRPDRLADRRHRDRRATRGRILYADGRSTSGPAVDKDDKTCERCRCVSVSEPDRRLVERVRESSLPNS